MTKGSEIANLLKFDINKVMKFCHLYDRTLTGFFIYKNFLRKAEKKEIFPFEKGTFFSLHYCFTLSHIHFSITSSLENLYRLCDIYGEKRIIKNISLLERGNNCLIFFCTIMVLQFISKLFNSLSISPCFIESIKVKRFLNNFLSKLLVSAYIHER